MRMRSSCGVSWVLAPPHLRPQAWARSWTRPPSWRKTHKISTAIIAQKVQESMLTLRKRKALKVKKVQKVLKVQKVQKLLKVQKQKVLMLKLLKMSLKSLNIWRYLINLNFIRLINNDEFS